MSARVFLDTGAIYALADRNDLDHAAVRTVYSDTGRLLKYWDESRVEAEGGNGKERVRRIPLSGLQRASDAARRPFCLAPKVASLLVLAGVARLAEIAADIGAALAPWPAPKSNSNAAHPSISTVSYAAFPHP